MKFVIHESKNLRNGRMGRFYFVLKANNNEVVATSEMYDTKQACKKGISAVKKCFFAKILDLTLPVK